MKRFNRLLAGLIAIAFISPAGAARAEENDGDVFLSLTRTAEPAGKMPTNVSVVTQEDIRQSGAKTLNEALEMLPSVNVLRTAVIGQYSTVRLRGVPTSNQVQVVVDGQTLGGVGLRDNLDIGQIPAGDIDRIEVIRGGASVLYGANATGGIVQIFTKKARAGTSSSIGYEAGSFNTRIQRADLQTKGKHADGSLTVDSHRTDGFQENSDGNGVDFTGNAGYSFDSGARLSLGASRFENTGGVPNGTLLPLDQWDGRRERAANNPVARLRQGTTLVRLKGALPLETWGVLQTHFYGSHLNYSMKDPLFGDADKNNNIFGNDTQLLLPGRATVGASYERDEYRALGNPKLHVVNWGLYAQKTFTLKSLEFMPAFRFDQNGAFGNVYNPRLTTVWHAAERLKFSANAGRSFRAPSLTELYADFPTYPFFGNPRLRPETAWSYDFGAELTPAKDTTLAITGFHTRTRDRIVGTATTNVNAPQAETSGVETELLGRTGWLSQRLSYTYQRAVGNTVTTSHMTPLPLTPRHMVSYHASQDIPGEWTLTEGARYLSRQFEKQNEKGARIPSFVFWNARLTKKVLAAELYLACDNIFNRHTTDFIAFTASPLPGRTFQAGISVRFTD